MTTENSLYPRLNYRLMRLLIPIALIYCVGMTVFTVLNFPDVPDSSGISRMSAFFQVLVAAPLDIAWGWLVMRRVPGNICGVLLVLYGCTIVGGAAFETNTPIVLALAQMFNQGVNFVSLFLLMLYFPTGTPLARWINRFALLFIIVSLGYSTLNILSQPFVDNFAANPLYIPALGLLNSILPAQFGTLLVPFAMISIALLISRFFQARGLERQQMRLMLWTSLSFAAMVAAWYLAYSNPTLWNGWIGQTVRLFSATWFYIAIPLTISTSVLQYRLYDIDIIIRRTLIYSILTGILAALYFGAIILTQQLFRAATGQTSDLAIVVSTLLIAALFTPIRRRVQDTIDRRLYRRKYDVEQTLANFQKNLREDVEMDTLKANLIGVVGNTMQPDKIALWVPPQKSGS